jgi:hypothetical protein
MPTANVVKVRIDGLRCKRCHYRWIPRPGPHAPRQRCPGCFAVCYPKADPPDESS